MLQVKWLEIYTALYANENIRYFNGDSGNVLFSCNETGIINIDLNNVNFGNNAMKMILVLVFFFRLLDWHIKFENWKSLKNKK